MNCAESKEAGPEAGVGRGKLVSYDWLTKSSPGLPVSIGLKVSRHLVFEVTYVCQFSKGAGLLVKTKQKN